MTAANRITAMRDNPTINTEIRKFGKFLGVGYEDIVHGFCTVAPSVRTLTMRMDRFHGAKMNLLA